MSSKYILEQAVINDRLQIEISEEQYKSLAHARAVLTDALDFEQRYELLLGNFIAMELALTEICLRAKVEPQYEYSDFARVLERSNLHLVNLLTAMRGYTDQVVQDFKSLDLPEAFGTAAKAELTKMFERSKDYRFMYALRNHVQHKAAAVHNLESDTHLTGDANDWADAVRFYARKDLLGQDPGFKPRILDEWPERIDVRYRARACVRNLGSAHLKLRELVAKHVAEARAEIESTIKEYIDAGAKSAIGLCARRVGDKKADVSLFLQCDDVRQALAQKNSLPPNLWPRRAHDEPKPDEVAAAREEAGQTVSMAAKTVSVPPELWQDYEDGLPMPKGLFDLYRLYVDSHPKLRLTRVSSPEVPK